MVGLRRLSEGDEDCHTKSQSTEKHDQTKKISYITSFIPSTDFVLLLLLLLFPPLRLCV